MVAVSQKTTIQHQILDALEDGGKSLHEIVCHIDPITCNELLKTLATMNLQGLIYHIELLDRYQITFPGISRLQQLRRAE